MQYELGFLKDPLAAQIVDTLKRERVLRATEIDRLIIERGPLNPSLATVYRRLADLIKDQVVIRVGRAYALNPLWLAHIKSWIDSAEQVSRENLQELLKLPECEGETVTYSGQSLRDLDPIWNALLLRVAGEEGALWGFNARPWYALGMLPTEKVLFQSLVSRGSTVSMYFGGNTVLDEYGASRLEIPSMQVRRTAQCSSILGEGSLIWASETLVVNCTIPLVVNKRFNQIFESTRCLDDFDERDFGDLFRTPHTCMLRVKRSRKDASQVRESLRACERANS